MDQRMIDLTQAAYTLLWNRFGLYKSHIGWIIIVVVVTSTALLDPTYLPWRAAYLMAVPMFQKWKAWQANEDYDSLNLDAEENENSFWRKTVSNVSLIVLLYSLGCLPFAKSELFKSRCDDVIAMILFCVLFYLMCVQIGEREPPEQNYSFNPV